MKFMTFGDSTKPENKLETNGLSRRKILIAENCTSQVYSELEKEQWCRLSCFEIK
jgi:hypothetical protein